jgi:AmmeMemoRadiSam system protein B
MSRHPAVANRFYPGNASELTSTVRELLPDPPPAKQNAIGAVAPHAGYIYSGSVCAETLNAIHIPETVVILGPNHHGQGAPISLSTTTWHMPMGDISVNKVFTKHLLEATPLVVEDESAHRFEHSLEVQLPFLQALQKDLTIIPLVLSHISYAMCKEIAEGLAKAIKQYKKPILILASSDMSHYESRENASKKDHLALDRLTALDPEGLYQTVDDNRISMCGVIPVTIMLQASILLGANTVTISRYTDSGDVSGDTDQVVGYAGAIIAKT